ncbi:MAG: hypothetical protein CVU40_02460 [Chloroflexi bacterium HGW-Chloroflexi-2]|jgi:hypothetical protein|nr:MAG: hypothetical protein CVU40_02460 [Chloroflexi bacterium HGW-Chloroflexi-2]
MITVIVHINNEDPIMGEVEELPQPSDQIIMLKNPRKKDGKDVHYLEPNVNLVIWPFHRITFIELIQDVEEDEIISFVRE